jgi:hypothetical protein
MAAVFGASFLAIACQLTHDSALAFIAPAAILILVLGRNPLLERLAGASLILVSSMVIWLVVSSSLGQLSSHPIAGGNHGVLTLMSQAVEGVGYLMMPTTLTSFLASAVFAAVIAHILFQHPDKALVFALSFCGLSLAFLVCLFRLTPVHSLLSDRFVLFVLLLLVPTLFLRTGGAHLPTFAVVVLLTMPVLIYRDVKWSVWASPQEGPWFFPVSAELSRIPTPGQSLVVDGRLLVGPNPLEEAVDPSE